MVYLWCISLCFLRKYEYPRQQPPSFYQVTNNSKERPDVWIDSPEKLVAFILPCAILFFFLFNINTICYPLLFPLLQINNSFNYQWYPNNKVWGVSLKLRDFHSANLKKETIFVLRSLYFVTKVVNYIIPNLCRVTILWSVHSGRYMPLLIA